MVVAAWGTLGGLLGVLFGGRLGKAQFPMSDIPVENGGFLKI
jgi:hypothetical protein